MWSVVLLLLVTLL